MTTNSSRHYGPRKLIQRTPRRLTTADSPPPSPPLTPPPLNHEGSPYSRVPLPPAYEHDDDCFHLTPVSVNPTLRFSVMKPSIAFDLLHHPSTITTLPEHRALPDHVLSEPATNPPLRRITITSPYLLWCVTVLPSRNKYVTVSDVLVTLQETLDMSATCDEYNSLPLAAISRVNTAYERRVAVIPDKGAQVSERLMGVKRIDFMMGRTRFMGLSTMGRRPDILVLNVL